MYGVIGEAGSDAATLIVLIRRLANNSSLRFLAKDFDGGGEILNRGAAQLRTFSDQDAAGLLFVTMRTELTP